MPTVLDRLDHELAQHRLRGEPEALAFHVAPDIAETAGMLMMAMLSTDRNELGITMAITDGRPAITYRTLPVIPHDIPAGMVLILGDSPLTRTLLGLAETDLNPVRAGKRTAFVGNALAWHKRARR